MTSVAATSVGEFFRRLWAAVWGPAVLSPERAAVIAEDARKAAEWVERVEHNRRVWEETIASPPSAHVAKMLASAGLPGDVRQVEGRRYAFWYVHKPSGTAFAYSGRVVGVQTLGNVLMLLITSAPDNSTHISYRYEEGSLQPPQWFGPERHMGARYIVGFELLD